MEYDKVMDKKEPVIDVGPVEDKTSPTKLDFCTMPHDAENSRAWNPDDACDDCVR